MKKLLLFIFGFTIFIDMLFINNVFWNIVNNNSDFENKFNNYIVKIDRYKIFKVHMKIYKILEKLEEIDFQKNKNIQLNFIDKILIKSISDYVEINSKNKILEKLEEILKNKWEIINNLKISNINQIEIKTYTWIWKVFYKYKVEFENNSKIQIEFINVFYNWEIWVYYRPQENILNNNYKSKDIIINLENKKIAWTLSFNHSLKSQNLIILSTWAWNNDRDFLSSRHRINVVLSNYLNNLWYAVFRYDKSWIWSSSWENFINLTTYDLSWDLDWIVSFFKDSKEMIFENIWLLWHSEWWVISSIVASKNNNISFLILLSSPYASLENMINDWSVNLWLENFPEWFQIKAKNILREIIEIIKNSNNKDSSIKAIYEYKNNLSLDWRIIFQAIENNIKFAQESDLTSKWLKHYLTINISDYLSRIKIPTLIINWNMDFIIQNSKMWEINKLITKENPLSRLIILENTWHMMEYSRERKDNDYSNINNTINQNWLDNIKEWINSYNITKKNTKDLQF